MNILTQCILFLRAILFYLGYICSTLCYAPIVLIICPFLPFPLQYKFITFWVHFIVFWLKVTCNIIHTVEGKENIPSYPAVVISKHQSTWETFVLQIIFVPLITVLKRELTFIPLFGWALLFLNPIMIDRSQKLNALKMILKQGVEKLKQNCFVLIFPEGTRVDPKSNKRSRYTKGGFMLAMEAKADIIPVAHNAGEHWHARRFIKTPGIIKLVIGKPITTENKDLAQITQETEQWIESNMKRISSSKQSL